MNVLIVVINFDYSDLLYEKADILPQNVNFAIKSDYLINLISMLPGGDRVLIRRTKLIGKKLEE